MGLPKGSMQLIDDAKLQQINERFSRMKTHLATGGAAANTILGLACLGAGTGFIGKSEMTLTETFSGKSAKKWHRR